ncbi:hypothetical protein [Siminovitchia fordii]|uniref:hypothetical protein n=1 Tax=Siminovitchia fordii TaxID=254759 RepID=UPI0003787D04|nr:hypothetical protein [Siminovitchia fordii]
MKRYFAFIISFILFYIVFEILSGVILTAFYTPDFFAMEGNLSQEAGFTEATFVPIDLTIIIAIATATAAYFVAFKMFNTAKS